MDTWTLREVAKIAIDRACKQVEAAQQRADVKMVGFEAKLVQRMIEPIDRENGPSGRLEKECGMHVKVKLGMVVNVVVGERELNVKI